MRDALKKDTAAHSRIDFVVFSGDLAWAGKAEEFAAARKELLDPMLAAAKLKPDRLFIAPGNHAWAHQAAKSAQSAV